MIFFHSFILSVLIFKTSFDHAYVNQSVGASKHINFGRKKCPVRRTSHASRAYFIFWECFNISSHPIRVYYNDNKNDNKICAVGSYPVLLIGLCAYILSWGSGVCTRDRLLARKIIIRFSFFYIYIFSPRSEVSSPSLFRLNLVQAKEN